MKTEILFSDERAAIEIEQLYGLRSEHAVIDIYLHEGDGISVTKIRLRRCDAAKLYQSLRQVFAPPVECVGGK